ncbi:hypothetical protein EDC01DRAFT_669621 [Geopyxis carbonaria]|nr:hypothetical protein EDC01DRAFT_669621 [Geopyxis carbonaria]
MEKFSKFRDRGTQIAPFLPIVATPTLLQSIYQPLLFLLRLPFFLSVAIPYLILLLTLPTGSLIRKVWVWSLLGVSGVWWVDLQVAGVKRGALATNSRKLPQAGSVIVSSYTSPLDAIYLAAIFDPVFAICYPHTELVQRVSLPEFLLEYFMPPALHPPPGAVLSTVAALLAAKPGRTLLLFPEATPTNGRGVLRFAPALQTAPAHTRIFPVSLKYTPADIVTPLPGLQSAWACLYALLSRPTHCIRVRIAEAIYNAPGEDVGEVGAEALAKIARVKRLNLGMADKVGFMEAWKRNRR